MGAAERFAALPYDVAALPSLPPEFWTALERGLQGLDMVLPDDARRAIDGHVRLLLAWNAAINLTSIIEPGAVATRHVLDSLTALPLLVPAGMRGSSQPSIVDLGSGGGFPGLPLAAAIPGSRVTLVESIGKKARFLEAAVGATGLADRVNVRAARAEALNDGGSSDVVTARAVGSLADLVELSLPLLRIRGRLLAWKRGDIEEEVRAGNRASARLGGGPAVVHRIESVPGLDGHAIVAVTKLRTTPDGFRPGPARRARKRQ